MTTRKTVALKTSLFTLLNNDATLLALLGSAGRVKYGSPDQNQQYPCVCYFSLTEVDGVYDADSDDVDVVRSVFIVEVFSKEESPAQADNIEDRVYALLNRANLNSSDQMVFTVRRDSKSSFYDADVQINRVQATYSITNHTL